MCKYLNLEAGSQTFGFGALSAWDPDSVGTPAGVQARLDHLSLGPRQEEGFILVTRRGVGDKKNYCCLPRTP